MLKKLLYILIGLGLSYAGIVYAANVSVPQATQLGDLPCGLTTGNYTLLHPGSNNLFLMASSTAPCGLTYASASAAGSGITSLNGQIGAAQTFATSTSGGIDLFITSGSNIHTFTAQPTSGYTIPLTASTTEWGNKLSTTTAAATYEPIQTKGNLTATAPLQFDNTRQVIGGAATVSVALGYNIPLTASTTEWNTAYGWGNHAGLYPTFTYASSTYYFSSNPSGYITSSALSPYLTSATAASTYVPYSYASSSYATMWNVKAGTNITISTTTGLTINGAATPTIIGGGTATGPAFTFATTTDTNILLNIVCGTSTCTFNPGWTGTLADARIASASTWNAKLSAYNVISTNGLISVSTTTALATLTASTSPTFTYVGATNASTTNLSIATNTYLTNVGSCSNGLITGTGGLVSCNAAAFLTATAANSLYPTFSYASSSYATLWNLKAGSNITISTSSGVSVAVSSTPSFTTLTVSGTTTLSAATTTINGLTYYWPSTVSGTKILQNDGSGNLSWVADQTGGGGSLSGGTTGFVGVWASSTAMTVGTLRDNGTVSGVNATSSSYTFNIQGSSNINPFNVSSSTGASLFSIDKKGQVNITGEGAAQLSIGSSTPYATLTVQGSSTQPTLDLLRIASSSNTTILTVTASGNVGYGSTTPVSDFVIQGTSGHTNPIFTVATSTSVALFSVASNGSTTISSLGAGPVYSTAAGSLYIGAATGGGAGTISTSTTATIGKVAVWTGLATLGNGALIDNGTVLGMNATSSTIGFNIQGTAGTNTILNIASSTGTSILAVSPLARVGINTSSPVAIFQVQGTTGINNTLPLFDVASSSGVSLLRVLANGNVGIGSSSPSALFTIDSGTAVGTASTTIMIQQKFQIDTYNSAGTRVCMTIVGTTPTVTTGACP